MTKRACITILACLLAASAWAASRERIQLRRVSLDLPGPPARVLATDLDADGRLDLVVVAAYTEIEQISEDYLENMVQITRVIPTLYDRRQVRAFLATASGDYVPAGPPLELPISVLHMEVGPPGLGLIALTDEGLAKVHLETLEEGGTGLGLELIVEDPPVLARTRRFYGDLELVHDLDGDGVADVLLPTADGLAFYLTGPEGLSPKPAQRLHPLDEATAEDRSARRWYPLPSVQEVNGDDLPDLVFTGLDRDQDRTDVYLGAGGGTFRPLREERRDCHDRGSDLRVATSAEGAYPWLPDLAVFRDIDGDGFAEAVTSVERSRGDSWRKEMKDAKKPRHLYAFHDLQDDLTLEPRPYFDLQVVGHSMEGELDDEDDEDGGSPFSLEQFVDLDNDGREDLVTVTLEFSMFQVIKILATKKIGIGFNFHVYAQQNDGTFREVPDLDLSEKLKFNLNNLKVGRFAQFAGDFDGDGRRDFVHLGRGTQVTIHRGQPGCRYPSKPDLVIELDEEPASLDLVRIEDIDGDGRSDIRITRPMPIGDPDVTAPARLDLYLSGEPR